MAPGESVEIPLYRSAAIQRLRHAPAAWDTATLSRAVDAVGVADIPYGKAHCTLLTAEIRSTAGNRTYRFYVQGDMLWKLERSDGYSLKLRGVERLPYWNQNRNADQQRLKGLGLKPRDPGQM